MKDCTVGRIYSSFTNYVLMDELTVEKEIAKPCLMFKIFLLWLQGGSEDGESGVF